MRPIRKANGSVRGYVTETSNRKEIRDKANRLLGHYDKTQDKTFDRSGAYIGPEDQTMTLLED